MNGKVDTSGDKQLQPRQRTRQILASGAKYLDGDALITFYDRLVLAMRVKELAAQLTAMGVRSSYLRIYESLYKEFGMHGYDGLRLTQYREVMAWLDGWYTWALWDRSDLTGAEWVM